MGKIWPCAPEVVTCCGVDDDKKGCGASWGTNMCTSCPAAAWMGKLELAVTTVAFSRLALQILALPCFSILFTWFMLLSRLRITLLNVGFSSFLNAGGGGCENGVSLGWSNGSLFLAKGGFFGTLPTLVEGNRHGEVMLSMTTVPGG